MRRGSRQPEVTTQRRLRRRRVRPTVQGLEARIALAIDLAAIDTAPYGVLEVGPAAQSGAGFSVANVGDTNGDGFDDFLVGAPSVNLGVVPPLPGQGTGTAFLIFGSNSWGDPSNVPVPPSTTPPPTPTNFTTFDWLELDNRTDPTNPLERIGSLASLGNPLQIDPTTNAPSFAYNGLTFTAPLQQNGQLGVSVAALGDINNDGLADFMIGAPGSSENNANNGTGRAYLVYGSPNLASRPVKTVDLTTLTPAVNSDLVILTFTNTTQPEARTGYAVAGIGDFLVDGTNDIAIGAPKASISGTDEEGIVYVINGFSLPSNISQTIPLETVGLTGPRGVLFSGGLANESAGFSVAGAGNTTGRRTTANQPIRDLLIGAPDFDPVTGAISGPGRAYLVQGDLIGNIEALALPAGSGVIDLARVGVDVPGAVFNGSFNGDLTGWDVNSANDFDSDGLADILIGSPGFDAQAGTNAGRATLIYGRAAGVTPPGSIQGSFNIGILPPDIDAATLNGQTGGALAGFAVSAVGPINPGDRINEIIIGSPGAFSNRGRAYLLPGNLGRLVGNFSLANTEAFPLQGLILQLNSPDLPNFFGASVSGYVVEGPFPGGGPTTADNDGFGDFIIGAPGLSFTTAINTTNISFGGSFIVEGGLIQPPIFNDPISLAIPLNIDRIDGATFEPFRISALTPPDMQIFVLSSVANPPLLPSDFVPVRDIDPTTIVVTTSSGVRVNFPNATVTADPIDRNNDGLQDAIITISPRSALGLALPPLATSLTVSGRTRSNVTLSNRPFAGTANIVITTVPPDGGAVRGRLLRFLDPNAARPPFGERLVPNPAALPKLKWRPALGHHVTLRQFRPRDGFARRMNEFYHGGEDGQRLGSRHEDTGSGTTTLGRKVFTRSQYDREGVFDARTFIPRKGKWWY